MVSRSRVCSHVIPVPVPRTRPRVNVTGPGARTVPSLSAYVACSVSTVMPSDPASCTSPSSAIDDSFLPTRPSFAVMVKVRSPFRSSVMIVTPRSLLEPSA